MSSHYYHKLKFIKMDFMSIIFKESLLVLLLFLFIFIIFATF